MKVRVFVAVLLAASLSYRTISFSQPADPVAAIDLAPVLQVKDWQIPALSKAVDYTMIDEPQIGHKVLASGLRGLTFRTEKNYAPGTEIRARFQLAAPAGKPATFTLSTAGAGPKEASYAFMLSAANNDAQAAGARVIAGKDATNYRYQVKAYPVVNPTWDAPLRASIEHDMAALPAVDQRWFEMKIQLGQQKVRYYLDDRLLDERPWGDVRREGWISVTLSPFTRLASLQILPLAETNSGFVPVSIGSYLNAGAIGNERKLDAKSLPARETTINGIPFVFPAPTINGRDHIDVGASNLRQANLEGYMPSRVNRFVGSLQLDPARLQFRVPNDRYDALYLIAAADGEKDNVPLLSASFYKPDAGFTRFFEANVPAFDSRSTAGAGATAVPIKLSNGRAAKLWLIKIPLAPGALSDFSNLPALEFELSKKMQLYRSYPDPINYGYHPGGLPSGVHVYAMTLHKPAVHFTITPKSYGHVWTSGETPEYSVKLENRDNLPRRATLQIMTRSYDGSENHTIKREIALPAGQTVEQNIALPVQKYGYHNVVAALSTAGQEWTETRSLVKLAPDTRAAKWEEGQGPLFGTFSYFGGHEQPAAIEQLRLLALAGARTPHRSPRTPEEMKLMEQVGLVHHKAFGREHWITSDWAANFFKADDPEGSMQRLIEMLKKDEIAKSATVDPKYMTFFSEPHVSRNLTAGNLPEYWGDPPYQMNEAEQKYFKHYYDALVVGAKAVRREWPNLEILIPWGDPLYAAPFLRAGFPKELIDGSGIDSPGFERLPEQQLHQISMHRLYELREEYRKAGIPNPKLHFVEGPFVPTEPGAVSWREQMDIYARTTQICMGYGMERFYSGWGVFIDAASYYGSEHYGGNGIFTRLPHVAPKPAYAAFATTTLMLDRAKFDKWLPTGSHSTYAIRYNRAGKSPVYSLWTLRGKRPVTLRFNGPAQAVLTDMMGNPAPLKLNGQTATFTIDTTPIWLTEAAGDFTVSLGEPDNSDAQPARDARKLANLGDGNWRFTDERDATYENNNFDTKRFFGPISGAATTDATKGKTLAVKLGEPEKERQLMPFYRVLRPATAVTIPGKASHLGMWVKGNSDWGRFIYSLRDAKGERWISIGTKDQWNCDDVHSWSSFNFDGWRYLRFEMPSNLPYDSFKEAGTTWWGHYGGDGTVDLPLKLENIIVERRTHLLYVNDIQPANRADVLLGDLLAEYSNSQDATPEVVRLASLRMPLPAGAADLPNPIARLTQTGIGAPTAITGIRNPDTAYDGTRIHVNFNLVEGAQSYDVWLSAYPDGRGAVAQGKAWKQSGQLLSGLRPARDLYLFVTHTDKDGKVSKPSAAFKINLADEFGMK